MGPIAAYRWHVDQRSLEGVLTLSYPSPYLALAKPDLRIRFSLLPILVVAVLVFFLSPLLTDVSRGSSCMVRNCRANRPVHRDFSTGTQSSGGGAG